ncbi:MAG: hypothetical protein GYB37_12075 [Algicola sp.]|nr:hypothetical protein [Algicola sp.]
MKYIIPTEIWDSKGRVLERAKEVQEINIYLMEVILKYGPNRSISLYKWSEHGILGGLEPQ